MRQIGFILLLLAQTSFAQSKTDSIVAHIDSSKHYLSYIPEALEQQGCFSEILFDSTHIYRMDQHCEGSIHARTESYYYQNDTLIYFISREYTFNAPVTFTEERAKAEGFSGGWFNPEQTITETYSCYFQGGKMIRMVNNEGTLIPVNSEEFAQKETELLISAEIGRTAYKNRITP